MYVCMYTCMYVCMYVRMYYVCMCTHTYTYIHIRVYICMQTFLQSQFTNMHMMTCIPEINNSKENRQSD